MPKHYFLGGNTPYGFYSYYDYLLNQKDAKTIYCIKGGPGTGKSSFMKKVAKHMEDNGFTVDYAHCSSDPKSLDGLIINEKNIAFVDGTSPHIVDPKTPGAVDCILNMGAFWDEDGIHSHKHEIISLNTEISYLFSHAYKYLASAKCIWDDTNIMYSKIILDNAHERFLEKIINKEFKNMHVLDKKGKTRKLFATAFTPEGVISTIDTLVENCKVYTLKGYTGNVLTSIANIASSRGLFTECYFNPMEPLLVLEHLVMPELKLAFVTSNKLHELDSGEVIDFNEYYQKDIFDKYSTDIIYNDHLTGELISKTSATISKAKKLHDELEKCYIPYMDFVKIDEMFKNIISTL